MENRIILAYLTSHCSHVLQPLDLAVFGPIKPENLSKADFIEIYEKNSIAMLPTIKY
jgi:hypothetical protein